MEQEMFVKHVCQSKLKCHCDLDLKLEIPNSIGVIYLTNHPTKLEDPWAMSFLVIDRIWFVYGPTDRPTKMCKAGYPHFFEAGHNKCNILYAHIIYYQFKVIKSETI